MKDDESEKAREEAVARWKAESKGRWRQRRDKTDKDNGWDIVLEAPGYLVVVGSLLVVFGAILFPAGLAGCFGSPDGANGERWVPAGIGLFFILVGVLCMTDMSTKVAFNRPAGHITVRRGDYPPFLWFLRIRVISREEAKSVFVRFREAGAGTYDSGGTPPRYEVRVRTASGRQVMLYEARHRYEADYLAKRIREFAQESDRTEQPQ